jgi:hypothetical protein
MSDATWYASSSPNANHRNQVTAGIFAGGAVIGGILLRPGPLDVARITMIR